MMSDYFGLHWLWFYLPVCVFVRRKKRIIVCKFRARQLFFSKPRFVYVPKTFSPRELALPEANVTWNFSLPIVNYHYETARIHASEFDCLLASSSINICV